jgi:hypothetical protein
VRDAGGEVYKGPVLATPLYVSLGIKPIRFIRLQAGVAFVQQTIAPATPNDSPKNVTSVKPMVGIALEFDFSFKNKNNLSNTAAKE